MTLHQINSNDTRLFQGCSQESLPGDWFRHLRGRKRVLDE